MAADATIIVKRNSMGERRHQFLQADGRWQWCAGPRLCRECIRGN